MSSVAIPLTKEAVQGVVPFLLGHRPALDGVRAFAVLLVLVHHLEFIVPITRSYLPGGFLGVDLFFVLSGFLITSLLAEEFCQRGTISLGFFYMRRALRLLPAVAAALLFSVVVGLLVGFSTIGMTPLRAISIVGYFTNWVRAFETPDLWFFAHFWSLAIEEQFYLIWPIVLLALLRRGISRRRILTIVALAALASIVWMPFLRSQGFSVLRVYTGSDTRAHTLLIGCLLSLALQWSFIPAALLRNRAALRVIGYLSFAAFLSAALWLSISNAFLYRGGSALIAISAALLILSLLFSETGLLASLMTSQTALWLGRRSYGLYVWHWPIYFLAAKSGGPPVLIPPVAFVLTILVAVLSYRFIESPFLKLKLRYASH